MARSSDKPVIRCPAISRQIAFHQLLISARKTWLSGALSEALSRAEPKVLKDQILEFAPSDALQILAAARIRDEQVFPTPVLLSMQPTLIGYYRLLAGVPQKGFYAGDTGMAQFKSMEVSGMITPRQENHLPQFCSAMGKTLGELVLGNLTTDHRSRCCLNFPF